MLLYGQNGVGKTTLACGMVDKKGEYIEDSGFPRPLLLISLEPGMSGGARSVRRVPGVKCLQLTRTEHEDPKTGKRIVTETVSQKMLRLAEEFRKSNPYKTVVIDSVTSLQDHILQEILGIDDLPASLGFKTVSGDQYKMRSERTKEVLRPWVDKMHPMNCHTIFIGKEKDHNPPKDEKTNPNTGKTSPDMRPKFIRGMQLESFFTVELGGGAAGWLQDACEYVGRLYFDREMMDVAGTAVETGEFVRALRIGYHPNFMARFRSDTPSNLPPAIEYPTYAKIKAAIDGKKIV